MNPKDEHFELESQPCLTNLEVYKSAAKPILKWPNFFLLILLVIVWLKLFDIVAYRITNKWNLFFDYFDGYRHPGSVAAFLPFSLDIIAKDSTSTKIIFTGDSTSGGLLYHHSQAIPSYLNDFLNSQGLYSHTYNMAFSGAHLSEQYFIMKESIDYSDIVIFPIHYSFFAGRGNNSAFISHPEIIDFLTQINEQDLAPLGLKDKKFIRLKIDPIIDQYWYFYRVHNLMPYILLGKPVKNWLAQEVNSKLEAKQENLSSNIDPNLSFSNQSKFSQELILSQNKLLWEKVEEINLNNPNLIYLEKIGQLKQESQKRFLAYFVPIDSNLLISRGILDEKKYNQIVEQAKYILEKYSIEYLDFNELGTAMLESNDFYNPDHLLPNGNQKVAKKLAEKLLRNFRL